MEGRHKYNMPVPGQNWHLKNNPCKVATVLEVEDQTDPKFPNWKRGYVLVAGHWYRNGKRGQGLDTFWKYFERS